MNVTFVTFSPLDIPFKKVEKQPITPKLDQNNAMKNDKITVNFIDSDNKTRAVLATPGDHLMNVAIKNDVSEIDGDCAGSCACATCHVYVDKQWISVVGQKSEHEEELLNAIDSSMPNSRLSCQIEIAQHLDGLIVNTPSTQA